MNWRLPHTLPLLAPHNWGAPNGYGCGDAEQKLRRNAKTQRALIIISRASSSRELLWKWKASKAQWMRHNKNGLKCKLFHSPKIICISQFRLPISVLFRQNIYSGSVFGVYFHCRFVQLCLPEFTQVRNLEKLQEFLFGACKLFMSRR